jgi:membrane protein implicated in regulation of membrane protease activity
MRALAAGAGMFALVLAVLLAAVGQLGKIDGQTLVAVLAAAVVAAAVAAWRTRGRQP